MALPKKFESASCYSVDSTDIFSNSFLKDLEILSALRLHVSDGTKA